MPKKLAGKVIAVILIMLGTVFITALVMERAGAAAIPFCIPLWLVSRRLVHALDQSLEES